MTFPQGRCGPGRGLAPRCEGCGGTRSRDDYLCLTCTRRLPEAERAKLFARDGQRLKRYATLLRQLAAGVPLERVHLS